MTITTQIIATAIFFLLSAATISLAQEADDLARSVVDLKQRLEKEETLAEAVKADLAAQIQTSESNLTIENELKNRTADDQLATSTTASRSVAFTEETKNLKSSTPPAVTVAMPLADIEVEVTTLAKSVDQLKKELDKNDQENTRRTNRRPELRSLLESSEKQLVEIKTSLAGLTPLDNTLPNQVKRARLLTSQRLSARNVQ